MTGSAADASPIALFLAHALALENDSAARYAELAENLALHNNPEISALFRKLGEYSRLHANEVGELAKDVEGVPKLAPWDFSWYSPEPPETAGFDGADYLMTPRDVLTLALAGEKRGYDYYAAESVRATDGEVVRLAAAFAAEEAEHVRLIERWLERFPESKNHHIDDLDPPNVVD
ncbi:MAG: rubrerythrin [Azospirillum sp.]|nr:rubrerythrin [Azospirillum sp.]